MRVPHRPWAEIDGYQDDSPYPGWDRRGRPDDLADRLRRLLPGHPSADVADGRAGHGVHPDDIDAYDEDIDDFILGDAELDYAADDDLELDGGVVGADSAEGTAGGGPRSRQAADSPSPASPGDAGREPYRPWFMADGTGEPWFAVKQAD